MLPTEAAAGDSASTWTCFREAQESPSWTQRRLARVGLSGHRAGGHSAEKGCRVAMKVHALPLLLLLSFLKLLGNQQILFPLHSLESVWVGLPLMPPVAQGALPLTKSVLRSPLSTCARVKVKIAWVESEKCPLLGKRWKNCKRLRESRVQLLQGMVKVGKQNFCWKIS